MAKQGSVPDLSKCANSGCDQKFQKLGQGCLTVLHVTDSEAWGLPRHVKQKVVWMCDRCSSRYLVRLDQKAHTIQLVHRYRGHGHAA